MKLPKCCTTVTPFSKALAIILFVSLPFLGFYFGNRYQQNNFVSQQGQANTTTLIPAPTVFIPTPNIPITTSTKLWIKPETNEIAVPFVKNGILYLYSITKKQVRVTQNQTTWGSGAFGLGEDDPRVSPDGKFIAIINQKDNSSLYLISAGGEARKITNYPIDYITSWSSDSSKILFRSRQDDLEKRKLGDMAGSVVWETIENFSKDLSPGFHSFNINTGVDMALYPLSTADKFIDSNRILVELPQFDGTEKTRYVLFNVDTFVADYSTVKYPIKSFGRQNSFSSDGKYWARTIDEGNSDSGVKIVFSKFPDEVGEVVDSAAWALIQRPLLNADGKYLAYTKKGEQLKEGKYAGQYPDKTIIYNTSTKQVIKELPGYPKYWVNGNILLIGRSEYGNNMANFTSFDLFHADTQKLESFSVN